MGALGLLSIGFAPGVLWLWLIVRRSRHRPEPRSLIVRTFLLGVLVAVPIVVAELLLGGRSEGASVGLMTPEAAAFSAFVVAGLCEELGKLWVVHATLRRTPYLDDPLRGLIFSSAVALGFSSIENVNYMLHYGAAVILQRAILCTLGHVAFSALWGFALGWAQQHPRRSGLALSVGVLGAIGSHGLYDYFLMVGESRSGLLTFALGAALFFALLSRARSASRSQHSAALALLSCRSCGSPVPAGSSFCARCGYRVPGAVGRHCGGCKAALPTDARFCPSCGANVISAA